MKPIDAIQPQRIRQMARVGFFARGAVYFVMGLMALLVGLGLQGGKTTDSKGSLREILRHPLGEVMLVFLGLGLFCYAIWCFLKGVNNYDHDGKDIKGRLSRAGDIVSGLSHTLLGVYAINLVFKFASLGQSNSTTESARETSTTLFHYPGGRFMVGVLGLIIIGVGVAQFFQIKNESFKKYLQLSQDKLQKISLICKVGLGARGIVFALIGYFFVQAAIQYNSQEAGGFAQAWNALRVQPFGDLIVAVVALGFMAFALYSAILAMYRRTV